ADLPSSFLHGQIRDRQIRIVLDLDQMGVKARSSLDHGTVPAPADPLNRQGPSGPIDVQIALRRIKVINVRFGNGESIGFGFQNDRIRSRISVGLDHRLAQRTVAARNAAVRRWIVGSRYDDIGGESRKGITRQKKTRKKDDSSHKPSLE